MAKYIRPLMAVLLKLLIRRQYRTAVQLARIKAAVIYVRGVQAARGVFLATIAFTILNLLLVCGAIVFHFGLFAYLPWTVRARGCLLMSLGAGYFVIAIVVLCYLSRQRFWMRLTGADDLARRAADGEPLGGVSDEESQ